MYNKDASSSGKYWDNEQPVIAKTDYNTLTYYAQAEKLQISSRDWTGPDGQTHRGKTVGLDLSSVKKSADAMAIFKAIFAKKGGKA